MDGCGQAVGGRPNRVIAGPQRGTKELNMDGSSITRPVGLGSAVGVRQDTLFRIVYYGEALRAMTEHVSDSLISGSCEPMIDELDDAFDRMSEARPSFSPEEFTLFVMSRMLGLCEDAEEARHFRLGAARYIVKSAQALPDDYAPIVEDARRMLDEQDKPAIAVEQTERADAPPVPAEAPALPAPASPVLEEAVSLARAAAPPGGTPRVAIAAPLPLRAATNATVPAHDVDVERRRPVRIRRQNADGFGSSRHFDKVIIGGAVAAFLVFVFVMMSGLAELPGYEIFSRERVRW
jgi:hypothetical protein